MRIAFVVHDYHQSGGHSRYVTELASRFCAEHEVHVFANVIHKNGAANVQFHQVPAWRYSAITTIVSFLIPATRQLNGDFDIIHAQGLCSLRSNVVTAHICNRAWYLARQANENSLAWKDHLFDKLISPMEKLLYKDSQRSWVIAISQRVHQDLADCYGRQDRTSVIYHGVDVDQFKPENRFLYRAEIRQQLRLAEADTVFLFVGDMRKGASTAMAALRQSPRAKLLFVSRTPPDQYRHEAELAGLAERVIFCPPTDHVERYYAAADAFLLPTLYDAFGMVITEAMASGLPVIVSRQAGAAELIDHFKNGILIEHAADSQEIARHMKSLIDDPSLGQHLGQAARKKIEKYTWDAVAQQTLEVYEQVLAEQRK